MKPAEEMRHIDWGPRIGEHPAGMGLIGIIVTFEEDVDNALTKVKDVLRVAVSMTISEPCLKNSGPIGLPEWFIAECAVEQSVEEEEAWLVWWRSLEPDARKRASQERPWSVADWLWWLLPDERQWYWWDVESETENSAKILIEVSDWPTPVGALDWLLRVAGAVKIEIGGVV